MTPLIHAQHPRCLQAGGHVRCAFTLMELLVVIVVLGVLLALLIPVARSAWKSAQAVKCLSNLRQITNAVMLYRSDHNGEMIPDKESGSHSSHWTGLVDEYLSVPDPVLTVGKSKVWSCPVNPALPKSGPPYDGSLVSYTRNSGLRKGDFTAYRASEVRNQTTLIMVIERRVGKNVGTGTKLSSMTELRPGDEVPDQGFFDHPAGTSVAFVDGHIESWPRNHPGLGGGKKYPESVKEPDVDKYWNIIR